MADEQTTAAQPATKKRAAPKGPDLPALERVIEVAKGYTDSQFPALMHLLETEEGVKITVKGDDTTIQFARLKSTSKAGRENALRAWLNKARRTVRGIE